MNPFVVVGPGRCGTSSVAKMLVDAGVDMGEWFREPDEHNPAGYWEDLAFRNLADLVLLKRATLSDWKHRFDAYIIGREAKGIPWGWKDPRTANLIEWVVERLPDAIYIRCKRPFEDIVTSWDRVYRTTRNVAAQAIRRRETLLDKHLVGRNVIVYEITQKRTSASESVQAIGGMVDKMASAG